MEEEEESDEFSAMAWEVAAQGKSGRDIATLHETWAALVVQSLRPDAFERAQEHLDQALDAWTGYQDPALVARTWCLKGSCSLEVGDFAAAASCFKRAQQLAEEAADAPLGLCVMANRAVCEIRRGDPKAAATRSRRALVKAEADGRPEMIMATTCIRASSYQMAGKFLAACNEHEAAAKLVVEGDTLSPEPALALAMETNFGISVLRSGKPDRAIVAFERALETARTKLGGKPRLTLARCLFHTGEARRQALEFTAARALLEEASALVAAASEAEGSIPGNKRERSRWGALAMEIANSRGLCVLAEAAQRFSGDALAPSTRDGDATTTVPRASLPEGSRVGGDDGEADEPLQAVQPGLEAEGQNAGGGNTKNSGSNRSTGSASTSSAEQRKRQQAETVAEEAAVLIAAGGRAGEAGGHLVQKTSNAILEGVAWSLAGRGNTDGAEALKRASRAVAKLMSRERQQPTADPSTLVVPTSEAVGESVPAGSEGDDQLSTLQLGVICDQGLAARGGAGLGFGCTAGAAAKAMMPPGKGEAAGDAKAALAAVAAARAATKAANAGWAEAGQMVKSQLAYAAQVTTDSARQLSVAHAHAGTIDLMTGRPVEAAGHFGLQLEEARKAGDSVLEALAERNLADTREVDADLAGALRHLQRCRNLAQRGRNEALEADSCRRLSAVYAEIAAQSPSGLGALDWGAAAVAEGISEAAGGGGSERAEDKSEETLQESEIEEKEDNDPEFLMATAAGRAKLFAERYETAVSGSQWPVEGGLGGDGGGSSMGCLGEEETEVDGRKIAASV